MIHVRKDIILNIMNVFLVIKIVCYVMGSPVKNVKKVDLHLQSVVHVTIEEKG